MKAMLRGLGRLNLLLGGNLLDTYITIFLVQYLEILKNNFMILMNINKYNSTLNITRPELVADSKSHNGKL